MKGQKVVITLLVILFLITGAVVAGGLYFYNEYKDKVGYFERQNRYTKMQLEQLDKSLNDFKLSLDNLNSQITDYVKNLKVMENKLNLSLQKNKDIFSIIGELREKIQSWEKNYASSLEELRGKIENLRSRMELSSKESTKEVELGKISVKKASPEEESPEGETAEGESVKEE